MDLMDRLTPLHREPTDGVTHRTHHSSFIFLYCARILAPGEGQVLIFVDIWSTRLTGQAPIWMDTRGSRTRGLWGYRMIPLFGYARDSLYRHMDTEIAGEW